MQQNSAIPLSAFLGVMEDTIVEVFGERKFWIIAETSDVKIYRDRFYAFLNLVEKEGKEIVALTGAAVWRTSFSKIGQFEKITGVKFENNLKVVLQVSVSYNPKYGLRLVIHDIDTSFTLGQISQQREQVLISLSKNHPHLVWRMEDRYCSANQNLRSRSVYHKIALIAAPNSDGYRDFVHELQNNPWKLSFSLQLFSVPVQGDLAHTAMVNAIQQANNGDFHAIVLVRGGGSQTDFAPYDTQELALAVASSKIPVFTGIGHERNISIVDELAFAQLKTPTKCAAYLVEINHRVLQFLEAAKNDVLVLAQKMIENKKQGVAAMKSQLAKSAMWFVANQKQKLLHQLQQIQLLDPMNTLMRGYALVRKNNRITESAKELSTNDLVELHFKDGTVNAKIIE